MKLLVAVIFALLAVSAYAEINWDIDWKEVAPISEMPGFWDKRTIKPTFNPRKRNGRIVGGDIVRRHSHPYQAGLLLRVDIYRTYFCGGSLISERAVLTAAHCPMYALAVQVILGAHEMFVVEMSQQRQTVHPEGFRIHPEFNDVNAANDIAILILPLPATLNNFVAIIPLPALEVTDSFAGQLATVSGWGDTAYRGDHSDQLRSVQMTIITNEVCRTAPMFEPIIIESTLCTSTVGGASACGGDSGSPLTVASGNGLVQVGVTSFSHGQGCESAYPNGYARITSFRQWIIDNQTP